MDKRGSHIKLQDILSSLDNDEMRIRMFKQLKESDPIDEDVKGLKIFLEQNNYNHVELQNYLAESKRSFDLLLDKHSRKQKTNHWLKYAAMLVPVLGLGYYLVFINSSVNSTLYAQYYEKEVGLPVTMGSNDYIAFNDAMNAYRDDEYQEAKEEFEELLDSKPNNDTLLYFLGCSNLELGKFDIAISQFQGVEIGSVFRDKSDYRLALLYVGNDEIDLARNILLMMTNNEKHMYNNRAKKLLEELN